MVGERSTATSAASSALRSAIQACSIAWASVLQSKACTSYLVPASRLCRGVANKQSAWWRTLCLQDENEVILYNVLNAFVDSVTLLLRWVAGRRPGGTAYMRRCWPAGLVSS